MSIISEAAENSAHRNAQMPGIDYARMQRSHPVLKGKLTRAGTDSEKVAQACQEAIKEWTEIGCWPDDWSNWQRALDDSLPWNQRITLGDLPRL